MTWTREITRTTALQCLFSAIGGVVSGYMGLICLSIGDQIHMFDSAVFFALAAAFGIVIVVFLLGLTSLKRGMPDVFSPHGHVPGSMILKVLFVLQMGVLVLFACVLLLGAGCLINLGRCEALNPGYVVVGAVAGCCLTLGVLAQRACAMIRR